MRLTVLGRSPAKPNAGEPCAGYLVEGGRTRIMLDAGPGTVAQLMCRATPAELDAVVISHMHTDHFLDLVTLRYAYPWREVAAPKLRVILPPGSADQMADIARGSGFPDFFDKSFALEEHDGERAFQVGDVRFEPYPMQHFIPTWGFRLNARGTGEEYAGTLAYSADSAPCGPVVEVAAEADLFICEAALRSIREDAPPPEQRGHLMPAEAGEIATSAGARRLVLTHLPVGDDDGAWALREASGTYSGPLELARILHTYEV
ncbi:MAG: MBL fold metallo-hydrolase [Candidatus Limnocylindria bacterium]